MRAFAISIPVAAFAALTGLAAAQTTAKSTTAATKKSTSAKATASKPAAAKQQTVTKSTAKANTTGTNTGKSTAPLTAKSGAGKANTAKRTTAKSSTKPAVSSYHAPQQQPTLERYQEIQQALADRGYFAGPVDGNWGPSSMDALKRFQHEQNLVEDGKVGSLSLIALGLGPKRGASASSDPKSSDPKSSDPKPPPPDPPPAAQPSVADPTEAGPP